MPAARSAGATEPEIREVLSGHLCRCTGYGSIVKAALAAVRRWREESRSCLTSGRAFWRASSATRKRSQLSTATYGSPIRRGTSKISSLVAAFDDFGLKAGDHLVTVLQNRWEAATIHWACQFAGVIVNAAELAGKGRRNRFWHRDAEARAIVFQDVTAETVSKAKAAQSLPRIGIDAAGASTLDFARPCRSQSRRRNTARQRRCVVADALHLGHDVAPERRAAASPRRAHCRCRPCGTESLSPRRTHAGRDAALPHDGRSLAAGDVAGRRHVRVPAAVRRRAGAAIHRRRAGQQSLSGADALPRSRASPALRRRPMSARCASSALPAHR